MARITKDPQVRIAEIIDAAETLFNTHGYQETQVSDIVKAVGVAQGTFYYYFKSKEEVVEAIVRRTMDRILAEVEDICVAKDMDASQKMSMVVQTAINGTRNRSGLSFEYLYTDHNLHILDKIGRQANELFVRPLKKIIVEGIEQKSFNIVYSEPVAEFILAIIRVVLDSRYNKETAECQAQRLEIAQKLIEAALGSKKGSILFGV